MKDEVGVLVVFTAKSVDQILEHGGTRSWVLSEKSMQHVEYVVCTRNADHQFDEECGVRSEEHNAAFLVGKVSGLKKLAHYRDRDRYLVEFCEYALVDQPHFRDGKSRNPITYSDVGKCRENGIDIAELIFTPMPVPAEESDANDEAETVRAHKQGLSMAEAKEGLSIFFGVPPESIQITISG
jgi:hypothetical protein